jgi:outer membrane protein assembly factor BamE (lipoprotein component of BamABCDE complex)
VGIYTSDVGVYSKLFEYRRGILPLRKGKEEVMKSSLITVLHKGIIVAVGGMVLFGCTTVGNERIIQDEIVSQIKPGKSTKAAVKALVGGPTKVSSTDTNEEVWDYEYTISEMRAATFIPVVGIFAGGADMDTYTLTIRFTKEGIVKEVGTGMTTSGSGSVFD